jgi:hypothetical protein
MADLSRGVLEGLMVSSGGGTTSNEGLVCIFASAELVRPEQLQLADLSRAGKQGVSASKEEVIYKKEGYDAAYDVQEHFRITRTGLNCPP